MNNEIGKGNLLRKIKENLNALINEVSSAMLENIGSGLEMELGLDDDEQTYFKVKDKQRIEELAEARNKRDMDLPAILWAAACIADIQQNSALGQYIEEEIELVGIMERAIEDACEVLKINTYDRNNLINRIIKFLEEKSGIEVLEASATTLETIINDFEQALLER